MLLSTFIIQYYSKFVLIIAHYLNEIIIINMCVQSIYNFYHFMMNSLLTNFYNKYAIIYVLQFPKTNLHKTL